MSDFKPGDLISVEIGKRRVTKEILAEDPSDPNFVLVQYNWGWPLENTSRLSPYEKDAIKAKLSAEEEAKYWWIDKRIKTGRKMKKTKYTLEEGDFVIDAKGESAKITLPAPIMGVWVEGEGVSYLLKVPEGEGWGMTEPDELKPELGLKKSRELYEKRGPGKEFWWVDAKEVLDFVSKSPEPEEKFMDSKNIHTNDEKPSKGKRTFKERTKSNIEKAAYRQGGRKLTNIGHGLLLYGMQQHFSFDDAKLAVVQEILESDLGKALLSMGVGELLEALNLDHEVAQKLAEEFQVSAWDQAGEVGLEKATEMAGSMLPMLYSLLDAVDLSSKKGLAEALSAWKKVDEQMPPQVRVALDTAQRIQSQPTRIETDLSEEEEAFQEEQPTAEAGYATCS